MRLIMVLALLGACEGSGTAVDAKNVCTKALYDPCLTEHDCMSGNCHGFTGGPLVCTTACTQGGPSCPTQNGAAVDCDASGLCKPAAANACSL
jgi:hypothetical protein